MKSKILGFLAVGLLAGPMAANAVAISAGQTLRYDFDFTGSTLPPPYTSVGFGMAFAGDLFDLSESFAIDFFDSSGSLVGTVSQSAIQAAQTGHSSTATLSPWLTTYDGYVHLRWLTGSVNVTFLSIYMRSGTDVSERRFTTFVGAVPEPGTLALLGLGLLVLGVTRRKAA